MNPEIAEGSPHGSHNAEGSPPGSQNAEGSPNISAPQVPTAAPTQPNGQFPQPIGRLPSNETLPPPACPPPIATQPAVAPYPVQPGQWTTGIFGGWKDPMSWVITCFFPCVTFGFNAAIIDRSNSAGLAAGLIHYTLAHFCCSCFYTCTYRKRLREQFSLPKEPCGDCLLHCCCSHCAINQEYRELKYRFRDPYTGWADNILAGGIDQRHYMVPPANAPAMTR